ncbi:MAG: hypothetical protein L6265_11625, partial [Thermoplasmatales archaeon]|nr:hypothetical protein [Thermoplasmatales archaeon]
MPFGTYVGNFTLTADGTYYIQYRAVDNAGNVEGTNTTMIKIDKTSPPVPTLISPSNDTWINTSTPTFNWSSVIDATSGLANYTVEVDNNMNFSSPEYTATVAANSTTASVLADGIYYWRVRAVDNASNVGDWSEIWIIKIDTQKPGVVTLIYPGTGVPEIADNTPKFEWEEVIDSLSEVAYYEIQVDDNSDFSSPEYWDNSTTNTSTPTQTLDDKIYRWRVRAIDNAKNKGDWSEVRGFEIKSGAPTNLELKINNDASYTNSTIVTLSISVDNPTSDYVLNFSNDGNTWSGWEPYSESRDWDLTAYGGDSIEGEKTVYVRCKKYESAPPESVAEKSTTITLDLTLPTVTLQLPLNDAWVNYSSIEFKWKAWDNFELSGNYHIQIWNYDKDIIIYEDSVSGSTTNNEFSNYSYSLSDGKYWWRVRANDSASNWCNFTDYWAVKIDTQKPAEPNLYQPADNNITTEMNVTFRWQNLSSNDLSGIYQYELQVGTNVFYIPGQNNSTTISLSDGTYNWKIRAADIAGNI